VARLWHRERWA